MRAYAAPADRRIIPDYERTRVCASKRARHAPNQRFSSSNTIPLNRSCGLGQVHKRARPSCRGALRCRCSFFERLVAAAVSCGCVGRRHAQHRTLRRSPAPIPIASPRLGTAHSGGQAWGGSNGVPSTVTASPCGDDRCSPESSPAVLHQGEPGPSLRPVSREIRSFGGGMFVGRIASMSIGTETCG